MAIELDGFDEFRSELTQMAARAGDQATNRALRAGARPIFEDMRRQAQIDPRMRTERLYRSLKIGRVGKTSRKGDYKTMKRISIGAYERDQTEMGGYAPHAHLVEYGHGGPRPAPPHPFVRPAYDRNVDEAWRIIRQTLEEELGLR